MTLVVKNLQKVVNFNIGLLENHVMLLRRLVDITSFDLGVVCYDNKSIHKLNKTYRDVDESTDVLAFPFIEVIEPGILPFIKDPEERILGDIALGIPYIVENLEENEKLEEVLPVMVTHGICHLIGYDHEDEVQWQQMYQKELNILQKFNDQTGYNCKPLLGVGHFIQ
ncbi:Endoribonuclease YbeY [Mytilus edulis]|uniref:Endoribonuclease YbeY n=1 Tax=Mytilus edulis TaxID=6550 RepID=A0A8S3Q6C4_MYTED|nr:Endoribonuclease YbeY [Mytilus edulis]